MHYKRMSNTVMALQSCHCDATTNHPAGEEFYKASPVSFYRNLRRTDMAILHNLTAV